MLELIREFRETHETPIVLFTYLNPVFTYGFEAFHRDAAAAGADGILLLDLPPDEAAAQPGTRRGAGLKQMRLIAPTTPPERVKLLAQSAEGFIYALSRTGVTGAHGAPVREHRGTRGRDQGTHRRAGVRRLRHQHARRRPPWSPPRRMA